MLHKWKLILTNWINCYFNETNKKSLPVNLESLLGIISHLRENLNLNESSLLDAHTVHEFIAEKYSDFKFENGSTEPDSEVDVYLAASLLLFFVCVNSKDVDIKSAMCSKLSSGDQEIILKFSKHLMECPKITITDVQAAIVEACGQDTAASEPANMRVMVAETPPALRSYHSEVRRLQAALDAERFDRAYLQEELTRTNSKVEKLLKDKEQYKLEIVNLKSQISQYGGQYKESQGDVIGGSGSSKLTKQLEEMEERFLSTQEQLENAQYERETYKSKLNQLKLEHDKLLLIIQQESSRASQLVEELENERWQTQSLRELVAELRQHNRLNKIDPNLPECDDPDASIQSLQHNSSTCSEVCVNVIEVQLGEERAKIVELKHEMQLLQDQLNDALKKSEEEKRALRDVIIDKEATIENLQHSVNVEINEKSGKVARIGELEVQLQVLQDQLAEVTRNFEDENQTLRNVISNNEKSIKDLSYFLNVEKDGNNNKVAIITDLEQQLQILQGQLSEVIRQSEKKEQALRHVITDNETNINNLKQLLNAEIEDGNKKAEKIMYLEQQLQMLQDQLCDITRKSEEEKQTLSDTISDKESTIKHLKHRVNLETDEKNKKNEKNMELEQQLRLLQDRLSDVTRKSEEEKQALMDILSDNKATIKNLTNCLKVETEENNSNMVKFTEVQRQLQLLQDQLCDVSRKSEEDKQALRKTILDNEITIRNLTNCLNEETKENNKIKDNITELEERLLLLQNELCQVTRKFEDEKQALTDVVSKNETTIKNLTHRVKVETEEKNEKVAQIYQLQLHLQSLQDRLRDVTRKSEEEKQALKAVLSDNETTIKNLTHCVIVETEENNMKVAKIMELERQLKLLQEQLCDVTRKSEDEKKGLRTILSDNEATLKNLTRSLNVETEEKNKKIENIIELEQHLQTLQDQLYDVTRKSEEEEQSLKDIISDNETTIKNLTQCLNVEKEGKNKKIDVIVEFEKRFLLLQDQLSEVTRKSEDEKQILRNTILDDESAITNLKDSLNVKTEELNEKIAKIVVLDKQLQILQGQLCDTSSNAEEETKILKQIISDNESIVTHLKLRVNDEIEEKEAEKAKVAELKEQTQLLQDKVCDLTRKIEEEKLNLAEAMSDKETVIANLTHCVNVESEENNKNIGKIKQLEEDLQLLQDQLSDVTKVAEEEKQALLKNISDHESTIVNLKHCVSIETEEKKEERLRFLELKQQMQLLKDQLSDTIRKHEEEKQTLTDIISDKDNIIANLKRRMSEEVEERKEERSNIVNMKQKTQSLQEQLCDVMRKAEEEKRILTENILDQDNIIASLKRVNEEEKKEERVKISEFKQQLQLLQDQLCDVTRKAEEEKQILTETISDKESIIANLKRRASEDIEEKKEERTRIVELRHQVQYLQDQICDITRKADEEKQTMMEVISDNQNTITNLKRRLNEDVEDKKEERAKIVELKQQVQLLQEQLNNITRKADEEKQMLTEMIADKENCIVNLKRHMNEEMEEKKEERARIVELKNQVQILQEQLCDVTRKAEEEHQTLKEIISEKESIILNLKHRVNEEIEERNILKAGIDNDVAKLNNELNELDQRLRGSQENSRDIIEKKVQEIQNLKDEKLSLLQSLSDETTKLENIIKDLQYEVDAEKSSKIKLRDDYDVHIMKLNEKVLNRNNELVELQNKIVEKGEQIEHLQLELRREKELREQLSNKHNNDIMQLNSIRERVEQDLQHKSEEYEKNLRDRDGLMTEMKQEKDGVICKLSKELVEEREKCLREAESKETAVKELQQKLADVTRSETDTVKLLRKENEVLRKTLAMKESFAIASQEKTSFKSATSDTSDRNKADNISDHTNSSLETYKTISDLEKILQDRNRTITSLQCDIIHLKSLIAESENRLLDVSKDFEVSKENCQQLSSQLKKIVHQKNEEIAELKKQVTKMSMTENRATQIIKVSAKYQAIILKRIAEIKSNTVLKELTNFGNSTNCDNELRRSLNAGTVTMEDLENFLDTTDRHLRRCSEKQLALQKERDRLTEVNRINESEIINMRKFLTELSVSIKTFNSVKDLYTQKLSRVVSLQRTVRRDILSLDGKITDTAMCKLERGYAAVIQDLSECAMNLERWVERSIGRAISAEKIKQAFMSEERSSLAPTTFQNTSLEVQLEELENSFCKLLEEVARAHKGEGAKDPQAVTVMELRAEYEDKLNRMKAKMRQLYDEQITIFKDKQRKEILSLEHELQKAREKLEESSRAYEEHIRALTTELWNVGEKFLMKKDEAEWLRRKQHSGSLMSLQHVHSSGLVPMQEEPSRASDTHSLRSLPVTSNTNNKNGRALHMSDEEGEVFDNRCLRELASTPRGAAPAQRLSELRWRNSLCPPHLKSSYPAETQFAPALHEEDIKCAGGSMSLSGRARKEVGITAYKKPGPPTPSKQAGRLSATDSELRESLRVETEPNGSRKTSTPSRIRALFRSNKGDTVEGTPRSRRLSNIFRKK